ncbi:ABC transporter, periplasmic substrate-binding protein [Roseobacter sp. MED193]|uniref:extracellular solute-binding protein n=1 Tax=Roseobacter sp. MED193 TaxID=314262 RepID=UPI000068ACB5|nr:extracellular solute-binding protein [Roseobacter sp. MED193]EAQ45059.1 ABC transporter, periplasmic substrate-binding protein [Roseobacter sp. MED193]
MYGDPALPQDFVSLPYANPNAPKGGRLVVGNTGGFDTLNPFAQKGTPPWQLRFWGYESLMGRSWDEAFTLYGLLAESVEVPEDRSWVEFSLRPEAKFSDGSPVTVEDVIWSYKTLGTEGHLRYRGFWKKISEIRQTGPRSLRISFNVEDRELALIAGLRPILQKSQWQDKDFAASGLTEAPIGTGPYVVDSFEAGRQITLKRNPEYWGKDLPFRVGTQNFDELRIDFFGDQTVLFEAFKAGELSSYREFNADKWASAYGFAAVADGRVVKSEIPHKRPSGMTGLAINTRRAPLDDWRVREALLLAFNFEYINETITGSAQPRISSYFSNSHLGFLPGPATGKVAQYLMPFAEELPPGTLEGYALPQSDGTKRNRKNLRKAMALLEEAGLTVEDGSLRDATGRKIAFNVLLRQGDTEMKTVVEIYARALERLGITLTPEPVDNAQYVGRQSSFDFDLTKVRRELSLSPGNEQRLYWGSAGAQQPGSRNLMGVTEPAVDAMIDKMLNVEASEDFVAATRALDRVLTAGRYVIPIWSFDKGRIAHARELQFPDTLPIYGDRTGFMPDVWWYQED